MDSLFVNGEWSLASGDVLKSINPATGHVVWTGKQANLNDVDLACKSAAEAFKSWSFLSYEERLVFIERFKDLLIEKQEAFAKTISLETGKVLWECRQELGAMIAKIDISKEAYLERSSGREREVSEGVWSRTRYRAIGVMAVFGPFNFPGHLPNGHIIPALLAGNTVVFKASEQAPLCGEFMMNLWREAALPASVLNLVQGSKATGEALVKHELVSGVLFTGSYRTGRLIHQALAGHPEKLLALEMGGNNPLVVHSCKDLEAAAYTIIQSAFITAGQRCVCARRLILTEDIQADRLLEILVKMTKQLSIADPHSDPEAFYGTMISEEAANAIVCKEADLIGQGAQVCLKAERSSDCKALIRPSILEVTSLPMREDEECFGPLLQVIRVKTLNEAIVEANNTKYGLSAGILCDSESDYEHFRTLSRAGIVNWNRQITGAVSSAPFGGSGCSGNYRPSAYFASDYCAYAVASVEVPVLSLPTTLSPGINWSSKHE